jgi:hypothetical protein
MVTAMVGLIKDIVGKKSLKVWFEALRFDAAQNQQIAVALAARAALWALILGWEPGVLRRPAQNYPPQDRIVVVLCAVLISTFAAKMLTSAIQEASAAAFADTDVVGA